jgi:hypothetical protein
MTMSVETVQTAEGMKSAWERIAPLIPEGCKMYLYFESHYGLNDLAGKPWEYVGEKWKVSLSEEANGKQTLLGKTALSGVASRLRWKRD